MQNQHIPVLIFAQSGRFIAQSATQAGYRVWVADCFGDQDTLHIADRWLKLDPISALTEEEVLASFSDISQGEQCLLIYGSGIERHYPLLNNLPTNIELVGNTALSIHILKTPTIFFNLLQKLALPYPDTQFEQPQDNAWLSKSPSGFGGGHIQHVTQTNLEKKEYYFQRTISGDSGSVLFISNGEKAQLLCINQQHLEPTEAMPFRLGSITSPWDVTEAHRIQLELAIDKITLAVGLRGINSLDFIISAQGQLFLLEVNPRISASAELLNNNIPLFDNHYHACSGVLPKSVAPQTNKISKLTYLYAKNDTLIPSNMSWPICCHDRPKEGILIRKNDPICTFKTHIDDQRSLTAVLSQFN